MFTPTYLSKADRDRYDALTKETEHCRDHDRLAEVRVEMTEIDSRRKPLNQCTYEECMEFKSFLFDKYRKVAGINKGHIASQIMSYMKMVDERALMLAAQAQLEEAEKIKRVREEKAKDAKSILKKSSGNPASSGGLSSKWSIDIDEFD